MKREEFTKMLISSFSFEKTAVNVPFTDVLTDMWYYPYICSAYNAKIVNGISYDTFGIGQNITREQMATIICRYIESKQIQFPEYTATFSDFDLISDYAKESTKKISSLGIIKGRDEGKFAPKEFLTRAESAAIMFRVLNLGK